MSRRSSPRSVPRRRALQPSPNKRRKRTHGIGDDRDGYARRPLRVASGLRSRVDERRASRHVRCPARLPSPRHRNVEDGARLTIPTDLLGVAAVFGVSLGAVLISIVLGLVGPSWFTAATMLACGAALALFVVARKNALSAPVDEPRWADPRMR